MVGRLRGFVRNWKVAVGLGVLTTVAIIGTPLAWTLLSVEPTPADRQFLVTQARARLDDPESLEAHVQIATCYRRLRRPNEARGTLEQARVVLQRIRADADFLRTTRLDRQQWDELLGWLRTL